MTTAKNSTSTQNAIDSLSALIEQIVSLSIKETKEDDEKSAVQQSSAQELEEKLLACTNKTCDEILPKIFPLVLQPELAAEMLDLADKIIDHNTKNNAQYTKIAINILEYAMKTTDPTQQIFTYLRIGEYNLHLSNESTTEAQHCKYKTKMYFQLALDLNTQLNIPKNDGLSNEFLYRGEAYISIDRKMAIKLIQAATSLAKTDSQTKNVTESLSQLEDTNTSTMNLTP